MCGPLRVTCRRVIPIGNWSPPRLGTERMTIEPSFRVRVHARRGLTVSIGALVLALSTVSPGLAREIPMHLKNAHVVPLAFSDLRGWSEDDHGAAYGAFLKSCNAIVNGGTPT